MGWPGRFLPEAMKLGLDLRGVGVGSGGGVGSAAPKLGSPAVSKFGGADDGALVPVPVLVPLDLLLRRPFLLFFPIFLNFASTVSTSE